MNAVGAPFANDPGGVWVTAREAWNSGAGSGRSPTQKTVALFLVDRPIFPPIAELFFVRCP